MLGSQSMDSQVVVGRAVNMNMSRLRGVKEFGSTALTFPGGVMSQVNLIS